MAPLNFSLTLIKKAMKKLLAFPIIVLLIIVGCTAQKPVSTTIDNTSSNIVGDTVRIANDELQYEVIIIDAGFGGWFNAHAKPRGHYSQQYLEARNRVWVNEWNIRASNPMRYGGMFDVPIDYSSGIDYGYEVNYMLYNYLTYYQLVNNIQLGGFRAHI